MQMEMGHRLRAGTGSMVQPNSILAAPRSLPRSIQCSAVSKAQPDQLHQGLLRKIGRLNRDGSNAGRPLMSSGTAAVASSSTGATATQQPFDPVERSAQRAERFLKLVELRSLYRNFVRAKFLLRLQSPIYTPPEPSDASSDSDSNYEKERELEEQDRRKEALEIVAEMQLTAEQLKSGLRTVPPGFGDIFDLPENQSPEQAEQFVKEQARRYAAELRERVAQELPNLHWFPSEAAALAAIEARNSRFSRNPSPQSSFSNLQSQQEGNSNGASNGNGNGSSNGVSYMGPSSAAQQGQGSMDGDKGLPTAGPPLLIPVPGQEAAQQLASGIEKLGQAEKVAEQFVATRIKPALRKARETEFVDLVRETGQYLKGLWVRLNGGGSRMREPPLSPDLPLPASTRTETDLAISQLSLELDATEQRLREAARAREAQLRRARVPEGRATMPVQLKTMDKEVLRLSRELAIRTLQIELEYIYAALEEETADIVGNDMDDLLSRQGSTTELRLLAAEFAYLDQQLAALASQLCAPASSSSAHGSGEAAGSSSGLTGGVLRATSVASPSAATATGLTSSEVFDVGGIMVNVEDLLAGLAVEVPDMRQRVGVTDQVVYGGQGFSLTKARLQVREALDKVKDAINFMTRGLKLLGSDISTAARLFGKAAMGNTLKPREVSAIRRTARDLLTFIPFTIILIIPLTPLGHVLVFGFIQTYFPSFFPSCFTSKRQELMVRYEELERQLLAARSQAEAAEEEAELVRAAAAVARLTAYENSSGNNSSSTAQKEGGSLASAGQRSGEGSGSSSGSNGQRSPSPDVPSQPLASGSGSQSSSGYSSSGSNGQQQYAGSSGQGTNGSNGSKVEGQRVAGAGAGGVKSGASGAAGAAAAWQPPPPGQGQQPAWVSSSIDEVDELVSHQTAQVKALEERVAAVFDDVTLGVEEEDGEGDSSSSRKASKAKRPVKKPARKQQG